MATPKSYKRRTYKDLVHSTKKLKIASPLASPLSSPCSSPVSSPRSKKLLFDENSTPNIRLHAEFLASIPLNKLENTTPDYIVLSLISQFGINVLCSLVFALGRVPTNFPDRIKYVTNILNLLSRTSLEEHNVALLQRLLECSMPDLISTFCIDHSYGNNHIWGCTLQYKEPYNAFLVPPVSQCIHNQCNGEIYFFHKSNIILHTFEGPIPAQKATFRCKQCKSIYNIDSFSYPGEGTRYYPFKTNWISASNRIYYSKDLHEFLCESG